MPENDRQLLISAAREAGDVALRFFNAQPKVWEKENDAGPVTEADIAVDTLLKTRLTDARPGHGWLSEETEDSQTRLSQSDVFIVDPIDGTRAFIKGETSWSLSLALAHKGHVTAAVVYFPARDLLFSAALGHGAWVNQEPLKINPWKGMADTTVLAAKHFFNAKFWRDGAPEFSRGPHFPLAYRFCFTANGAFDGTFSLRPLWEWDIAAGTLIVAESGGTVSDRFGNTPIFNSPSAKIDGIVAGNTTLHQAIIQASIQSPA